MEKSSSLGPTLNWRGPSSPPTACELIITSSLRHHYIICELSLSPHSSYHTTMLPNIFHFEGSTGPVQQLAPPTATPQQVAEVTVEVTMEQGEGEGEGDDRSRRSQTPSPEEPRAPPEPAAESECLCVEEAS